MIETATEHYNEKSRRLPDALLKEAKASGRGRLKIFFGAAPGVGKTYEMLTAAQVKRREGIDVVVGVIETHGRRETEALVDGFEVVSRRVIDYKGQPLTEMDLDALLERHPQIALVDELAHTNVPGSRHPKRYMDVEELIAAGIDVYTTLNIQHVESLNDVVARITRVRVRETVPDFVIDNADDIELVDLTPEDLIERLKAGKIYLPEVAERARKFYFSLGNLTALRELALRRTAQRVDAQMLDYMQAHAIEGPWPAGERVLVCIGGDENSQTLVRQARRLSEKLRAPWVALHIETGDGAVKNDMRSGRISEALSLAERLGGSAMTLPGERAADSILDYARANNCTHILVGQSPDPRWLPFTRTTVSRLLDAPDEINLHVIKGPVTQRDAKRPGYGLLHEGQNFRSYIWSLGFVAVALGCAIVLQQALAVSNLALAFLVAVLASAINFGLLPSLFACVASVLAFNFFLIPPLYTFTITDPENVVALFFFGVVAIIASNLAARVRAQAIAARQRAGQTEELYLFSRKLAGVSALDDLLWVTVHQIALMLKVRVVLLLPADGKLAVQAGYPPEDELDPNDLAAAQWSFDKNTAAGRGADTLPGAKRLFIPLRTGREVVGIVGIDNDRQGPILEPEQKRLLTALADQAAIAIERINLADEMDRARVRVEAEKFQSALLTSISHDLRTPLASILGAATSLIAHGEAWTIATRDTLMKTIAEEAERLNRFIGNLLDMTRLESGSISPNMEIADLSEVVGAALRRTASVLHDHEVFVHLASDLPMVQIDMVLMEQVIFNLLDNAGKYSRSGSPIELRGEQRGGKVALSVLDEGPGLPQDELEKIFSKFYRVQQADRGRTGTGLGLAICRGFVEAMKGTITAENRKDKSGTMFTILLPAAAVTPLPEELA